MINIQWRNLRSGIVLAVFLFLSHISFGQDDNPPPSILFMWGDVQVKTFGNPPKSKLKTFLPDEHLQNKLQEWGYSWTADLFSTKMTWDDLKQFNAVVILDFPDIERYRTSKYDIRRLEELLHRYVHEGGGLMLTGTTKGNQWGLERNTEELNLFLKTLGAEVLLEQVEDQNPAFQIPKPYPSSASALAWTDNITPHFLTKGVTGFLYPSDYGTMCYYTHPVKVTDDWDILIRGSATARSVTAMLGAKDPSKSKKPGSLRQEPPLLAVRKSGRGRIVLWPMIPSATIIDGYHRFWGDGLTMVSRDAEHPSEGEVLIGNLLKWLVEPSQGVFGGYVTPSDVKVEEKPLDLRQILWDKIQPSNQDYPNIHKGLIGLKSSLSTGTSSPADMLRAAREAGYDFAAFSEDLAQLTEKELEDLKTLCVEQSGNEFQAFAGFIYHDPSGNTWQVFGNDLHWPKENWWSDKKNGILANNNVVFRGYQLLPVIMVHPNRNPEQPWFQGNFKGMAVYTYQGGKLLDDATGMYRRLLDDDCQLFPTVIHFVRSVDEVKQAAGSAFMQNYVPWYERADLISAYSGLIPCYKGSYVYKWPQFISSGPMIESFKVVNFGTADLAIPGNDRFRMHIRLTSEKGLKEVRIFDGRRLWRRFLLSGDKDWSITLDSFHDSKHHFILEVEDMAGNQVCSGVRGTSVQELNILRCSDNLNTYETGKFKATNVFALRGLENYVMDPGNFQYIPKISGIDEMERPAVEQQLNLVSRFGFVKTDIIHHFYPPTAKNNWNAFDIPELALPQTALKGEIRVTLFRPWSGSTTAYLVQGRFEALRDLDVTNAGINVYRASWLPEGEMFVVSSKSDHVKDFVRVKSKQLELAAGQEAEYVANINSAGDARALIPLAGDFKYLALPDCAAKKTAFTLLAGIPVKDGLLRAGESFSYEYMAVSSRIHTDETFVEEICVKMGLREGTAYSIKTRQGQVLSTRFILHLKAEDYGFAGTITETPLPMLLPVTIEGLNEKWPAGILYKGSHTFMVPVWKSDLLYRRYTEQEQVTTTDRLLRFGILPGTGGLLQVDTEIGDKDIYIGNLLVCDNPDIFLELEDWRPGCEKITANNPTNQEVTITIKPGPGFDLMGTFEIKTTLPAGGFTRVGLGE